MMEIYRYMRGTDKTTRCNGKIKAKMTKAKDDATALLL